MAGIKDEVTGNPASVTNNNLHVALPGKSIPTDVGAIVPHGEAYEGDSNTTRALRPIDVSRDFRLRAGLDASVFFDAPGLVNSGGTNLSKYIRQASAFAVSSTNGYLNLNSGAVTTANGYMLNATYAEFTPPTSGTYYVDAAFRLSAKPSTGQIVRCGLLRQPASATANADEGLYLELAAGGGWQFVHNYAGSSTAQSLAGSWQPTANRTHQLLISAVQHEFMLYIDEVLLATVPRPQDVAGVFSRGSCPLAAYLSNGSSSVASATVLSIGQWSITDGDLNNQRTAGERAVISGDHGLSANGALGAQLANIANSAAPASATLSNTTAGYATPGGNFQWAAVAGAATDYALFAYLNPAASSTQRGQTMMVNGITVDLENSGAANSATVPTTVRFYVGVGSTAVSLATADAANARAPRRVYVGAISIPVNAVVGQLGDRTIDVQFSHPYPVEPGTYLHIIARITSGAATASQVITGAAMPRFYFLST